MQYKGSEQGVLDASWNVFPEVAFLVGCLAMAGRPLVLGHRGASAVAPENTVAAFAKARELGADGVELDVRRTADGVLVVHHDPDDRRRRRLVASSRSPSVRAARPDVPTLDEALDALPRAGRERRGEVPPVGARRRPRRFRDARDGRRARRRETGDDRSCRRSISVRSISARAYAPGPHHRLG